MTPSSVTSSGKPVARDGYADWLPDYLRMNPEWRGAQDQEKRV
jgi:hypothetical protein